ncbi:RNA polymerase II transcriptional coactivator KELP [Camellia lanceoleosa]|uniref:RNA polymerase II transcriptional coactivator KELP n=1 Tax=Camellia lanceoleosa TaxID=1840588 RepID=A0ACC0FQ18_9ERIC|nr:RNA polymerase II transcriptional coactivator KELP [Camellia lanceoleosa]
MEPETQHRIEETVLEILKSSNMDETTEYKVREMASEKLGLDLSASDRKRFVRQIVESYLTEQQSKPESEQPENEEPAEEEEEEGDDDDDQRKRKRGGAKEYDDDGDLIICRLSQKRKVTIQDFRGKTLVSMREYFRKDGKDLPTAKGISLTAEQWSIFKKNVPAIEKAIQKMESRLH